MATTHKELDLRPPKTSPWIRDASKRGADTLLQNCKYWAADAIWRLCSSVWKTTLATYPLFPGTVDADTELDSNKYPLSSLSRQINESIEIYFKTLTLAAAGKKARNKFLEGEDPLHALCTNLYGAITIWMEEQQALDLGTVLLCTMAHVQTKVDERTQLPGGDLNLMLFLPKFVQTFMNILTAEDLKVWLTYPSVVPAPQLADFFFLPVICSKWLPDSHEATVLSLLINPTYEIKLPCRSVAPSWMPWTLWKLSGEGTRTTDYAWPTNGSPFYVLHVIHGSHELAKDLEVAAKQQNRRKNFVKYVLRCKASGQVGPIIMDLNLADDISALIPSLAQKGARVNGNDVARPLDDLEDDDPFADDEADPGSSQEGSAASPIDIDEEDDDRLPYHQTSMAQGFSQHNRLLQQHQQQQQQTAEIDMARYPVLKPSEALSPEALRCLFFLQIKMGPGANDAPVPAPLELNQQNIKEFWRRSGIPGYIGSGLSKSTFDASWHGSKMMNAFARMWNEHPALANVVTVSWLNAHLVKLIDSL